MRRRDMVVSLYTTSSLLLRLPVVEEPVAGGFDAVKMQEMVRTFMSRFKHGSLDAWSPVSAMRSDSVAEPPRW
jgi:hypothetical protein